MLERLLPTINRLIEKREMQIDEMDVLQLIHQKKKDTFESAEDKAKQDIVLAKIKQAREEVLDEIKVYKELI